MENHVRKDCTRTVPRHNRVEDAAEVEDINLSSHTVVADGRDIDVEGDMEH